MPTDDPGDNSTWNTNLDTQDILRGSISMSLRLCLTICDKKIAFRDEDLETFYLMRWLLHGPKLETISYVNTFKDDRFGKRFNLLMRYLDRSTEYRFNSLRTIVADNGAILATVNPNTLTLIKTSEFADLL